MRSYKTYTPVDFAQEQSFINWVFQQKKTDVAFWNAWVEQHPERASDIDQARQLVLSFKFKQKGLSKAQEDSLWAKIDANTSATIKPLIPRRTWLGVASLAAAVAGILVVINVFFDQPDHLILTQNADWEKVSLPDASTVHLNAASKLSYDDDWTKERVLELEGEAFFEVEKGRPFKVITPNGVVKVLGTSFNVFSRGDFFEVECNSGMVEVLINNEPNGFKLNPGDKVTLRSNKINENTFVFIEKPSWIEGVHEVPEETYKALFEEMSRQYNKTIEAPSSILKKGFSGTFDRSEPFLKELERACFTSGFQIEERNSIYYISE